MSDKQEPEKRVHAQQSFPASASFHYIQMSFKDETKLSRPPTTYYHSVIKHAHKLVQGKTTEGFPFAACNEN